jgi:hypothetical protein
MRARDIRPAPHPKINLDSGHDDRYFLFSRPRAPRHVTTPFRPYILA